MVKDRLMEKLFSCLNEYKDRIKTARGNELVFVEESIEDLSTFILAVDSDKYPLNQGENK
jgi:hypothetical protein